MTHAITKLTLENFRNYRALSLEVDARPVVLIGHNGAGKTNILEAISLLAPGRGLRGAKLKVMDCKAVVSGESLVVSQEASRTTQDLRLTTPWVVAAQVQTHGESAHVGTGRDGESAMEKRIVKINGEKIRTQAALAKAVCVQWLTPSMDQVFVEGGSARRNLLDRMVFGFDPEHAARVAAYTKAMRERNHLLADRIGDDAWLTILERQMAEHAVAMTLARLDTLARVAATMHEEIAGFPTASLRLEGYVETALGEGASALQAETMLAERLAKSRASDARSGRCSEGAHRSQFEIMHHTKCVEIEHCSTGEQKSILLSLILAAAKARAQWCGVPPILLLDEVIAHLDTDKRRRLFNLIAQTGIQAWMTGTDAADFSGVEGMATVLRVSGGRVEC